MSDNTLRLGVDLSKYPTLARFSMSDALIRVIIGPAGSLKTSYCFNEILRRATMQTPDARGVRHTRWVAIRNTFEVLKRATMDTAKFNIPEPVLVYTGGMQPKAEGEFELSDGTSVNLRIDFLAVDNEDVVGKLLGYEYTGGMLDELTELPEEVMLATARRAGRFPPKKLAEPSWFGVIGATNGPLKNHWLYKWHRAANGIGLDDPDIKEFLKVKNTIEDTTGRPFFELFMQPPALIRPAEPGGIWLPNPAAENVHNLPGGYAYYFNMLAGSDHKIAAYVEGKFSDLPTGKVIFTEFDRKVHVIEPKKIPPLDGHPLLIGADFGRTPAMLIAAETLDGTLVVMDEVLGENTSIEQLLDNDVIPLLNRTYPRSAVREAFGDPAGAVDGQATAASPFGVCRGKNIPMRAPTTNNQYPQRIDAVKWYLTRRGKSGRGKLLVSSKCVKLIDALERGYVYENKGNGDTPTKSHDNHVSDIADALQYLCLGVRLRGERTARKPTVQKPKRKATVV